MSEQQFEERIARLEQERGGINTEDLKQRVSEVIRRLGQTYGAPEIADQALREMGFIEDTDPQTFEITLEVVVRSTPNSVMPEEFDLVRSRIEHSIPDLRQYGNYILDNEWSDTELCSVEVKDAETVER